MTSINYLHLAANVEATLVVLLAFFLFSSVDYFQVVILTILLQLFYLIVSKRLSSEAKSSLPGHEVLEIGLLEIRRLRIASQWQFLLLFPTKVLHNHATKIFNSHTIVRFIGSILTYFYILVRIHE